MTLPTPRTGRLPLRGPSRGGGGKGRPGGGQPRSMSTRIGFGRTGRRCAGRGLPGCEIRRALSVLTLTGTMLAGAPSRSFRAQEPPRPPGPVLGIVEVPRLFGSVAPDGRLLPPEGPPPLMLRREPVPGSTPVARVASAAGLESTEYAYEAAGALVYGRDGEWSLLRTRDGTTGWIAPDEGGRFHPLEELLGEGLTYLTDAWDGGLRPAPGSPDEVAVPRDPRRRIVGYVEPRTSRTRVVLEPGDDPDTVRARYRASASSLRTRPDGTRVMDLEVGTPHPLFEEPDGTAPVVAEVETNRAAHVLAAATGGTTRVPVFSREPGWFEVALRSDVWRTADRAWLRDGPAWSFQAVTDQAEAERFMSGVWGPAPRSVRVLAFRRTGGRLWVEVEVLEDSPCVTLDEPEVVARGWIPAHDDAGAPRVWFHSRGC